MPAVPPLQPTRIQVTCVDERHIELAGVTDLDINWGPCQLHMQVMVMFIGHRDILGMDALCHGEAWTDVIQNQVFKKGTEGRWRHPPSVGSKSWGRAKAGIGTAAVRNVDCCGIRGRDCAHVGGRTGSHP